MRMKPNQNSYLKQTYNNYRCVHMRGKILMIKMTESIFVVSDLLWHLTIFWIGTFPSYENSLSPGTTLVNVFIVSLFPLFNDFVSLLISPQTRLSRNDKAKLSLWNLSVDSCAALLNDIAEHICSSKLHRCVSSALFLCVGHEEVWNAGILQTGEAQQGAVVILRCCLTGTAGWTRCYQGH